MSRYSAAHLTSAGSTTLPISSLYGSTSARVKLRELQLFNTGAAALQLKLVRVTTLGTAGAGQSEMPFDTADVAATASVFTTHTVTPTVTSGDLARWYLPAGGGLIPTFPDNGIVVPATANAGLALLVSTGTGQICEVTWIWDEA